MSKHTKYYNENLSSNVLTGSIMGSLSKMKKSIYQNPAAVLRDSTNVITNLMEKNSLLLDTPVSSKEVPHPVIYTLDDPPVAPAAAKVNQSITGMANGNNSNYNTPAKACQAVPPRANRRKGYDEDLVNFELSPYGRNTCSRGLTPRQVEKADAPLSANSNMSSARRSQSEDIPTITPRTKLAQLRQERREEKVAEFEVQINDIKLQEMQQELRQIPDQLNITAAQLARRGDQMKESLRKLRSLSKSRGEEVEPRTQLQNFRELVGPNKREPKLNESRAISPLATGDEKAKVSHMMEEKCEKETEQTRTKVAEIEARLTLEQRMIEQHMWQVRRNAFCELGKIFSGEIKEHNGDGQVESRPFDKHASWLRYMLKEGNLIALYEGLNTILIYAQYSPTLGPAVGLVPDLLDKVPVQRTQFQEMVIKILCELVRRDQGQYVVSELINRFNSRKASKAAHFAVTCLLAMLNTELYQEIDLKHVYKAAVVALNSQKEIRSQVVKLLQEIFELVEDPVEVFLAHFPENTKPLVAKEVADILKNTKKKFIPDRIILFSDGKFIPNEHVPASTVVEQKVVPVLPAKKEKQRKGRSQIPHLRSSAEAVNLYECISEDIMKLVYVTKAEEKKSKMEELNEVLQDVVQRNARVEKKDYSGLLQVLCTLLEDTNIFLQLEVLKSLQLLATLLNKDLQAHKPKQIVNKLLERLKENKTAVTSQIENTVAEFLSKGCITPEALIDTVMQKSVTSRNPRVRQMSLQVLTNQKISCGSILSTFGAIIGPKLLSTIQKDPAAGVRDAAVALLTKIKLQCPNAPEVEKVIAKLPKARIQAIYSQVRAEVQTSKTPREVLPLRKVKEAFVEVQRSKSEMKVVSMKSEVVPEEDFAEMNKKEEAEEYSPGESVKKLLQMAESCTYDQFLSELHKLRPSDFSAHRPHVLYAIVYLLTRKLSPHFSLPETHASTLSIFTVGLISNSELTDQELDCVLSSGIVLATVLRSDKRHHVLQNVYSANQIDRFVNSLQKVMYTFKYNDENDANMSIGMTAYKTVAEWLVSDFTFFKASDLEKLSTVLNINSTMGFKREFVVQMDKVRQHIIKKNLSRTEQEEIKEAIANANTMAMNLKAPTPRARHGTGLPTPRRMSRSHQQLKDILEGINHKEVFKNKKAIESFNAYLDEMLKMKNESGAGILYAPYLLLQDLVEGICKLVSKAQWLEDDVLNCLEKLRSALTAEEASKMIRVLLQSLSDYMQPESKNCKHLAYYKVINAWGKEMSKSELTLLVGDIFSGCSFRYDSGNNRCLLQLRALLQWLSTQILGEFFAPTDIEPVLVFIIKGIKSNPGLKAVCEGLLRQCYKVFGIKKAQQWLEESLAQSQPLYKIYAKWHDELFKTRVDRQKQLATKTEVKIGKKCEESKLPIANQKSTLPQMIAQLTNLSSCNSKHISFDSNNHTPKETPQKVSENPIAAEEDSLNPHLQSSLMKHPLDNYMENSPEFCESEGPQADPLEKLEKNQIACHGSEESKKSEPLLLEAARLNTAPNVLQELQEQVTSPRFGSEQGIPQEKKSEDTPLSLQELDSDTAPKDAVEGFNEGVHAEPIPLELLAKINVNTYKLQCILLEPVNGVSQSLVKCFTNKAGASQRLEFAKGLNMIVSSEDVLQCVPIVNLHGLMDSCLKMCVAEKLRIMNTSNIKEIVGACNNVVAELQGCLNKIVNSHSFTVILSMFIALLKANLPEDFSNELSREQVVYFRLLMICLQKTFKTAQDPKDAGLRTFAVLLELNKLFAVHPPEKLKQNLPSLAVFDYVYKILREVTDGVVESDLGKSVEFVTWIEEGKDNTGTFLKYVKNVLARSLKRSTDTKQN
eukprot:TRINITY_DN105882_c3_g1_i1.p1 TRINITY_DN105882_c3_g1~~TRINITY_DN105882_c3_g1_i1.p1  ORF type:complete len:1846 (-),score=222.99 TRINITY_DN105882_c3_g1_i1:107-5644(-)